MSAVVLDVNLSLDGFVAAPGSVPGLPLGEGGDRLREWAMGPLTAMVADLGVTSMTASLRQPGLNPAA